jgi:hypothetical protein
MPPRKAAKKVPAKKGPAASKAPRTKKVAGGAKKPAANKKQAAADFVFTKDNFKAPSLPSGLREVTVPLLKATDKNLKGFGKVINDPDDFKTEKGTFEIVKWPVSGWRQLDPGTGDEAGTTEGVGTSAPHTLHVNSTRMHPGFLTRAQCSLPIARASPV